jgi:DEAD/DEAH box helicase domain-containing protein
VQRRSANVEAVDLLTELVRRRAQTIVFCKARIVAELVYKYAREALAGEGDLAGRLRPYRGGYLPDQRRRIERELFSGRLLAVSSTNALELGIDVGSLDAAILVGFPGTVCSTWQQAGRAGRSTSDSLAILVAYNDPVDQYLMRHPEYFFGASHEHAVIDPDNPYVLAAQVACAAFEKPLTAEDERWLGPLTGQIAEMIAEDGQMKDIDGRHYWSSPDQPAQQVGLRNISQNNYAIVDASAGGDGTVIAQVDAISAPELVYPEAVYLHEAKSYLVRELDTEAKIARVEPAEVDYYTQPILASHCRITGQREGRAYLDGQVAFGDLDVTWQTTAFRKVKYYTMELIGQAKLDLPAQTLPTTAVWWTPSAAMREQLADAGHNPVEALVGLRNLMAAALPAMAMCDRRDISGMVDSSNLGEPTIFIYDRYPGGMGFAQKGFQLLRQWLELARDMVADCPCEIGCPSCVAPPNLRPPIHGDPDLGAGYAVPDKAATLALLDLLRRERARIAEAAADESTV